MSAPQDAVNATRIAFRPARPDDFDYCARLYVAAMDDTIRELGLDRAVHAAGFRARWHVAEVRIVTRDGTDIGWLQTARQAEDLFLGQLFIDAPLRRQGIGTEVMTALIREAAQARLGMTLGVVKSNPARALYERLGFRTTHEDDRKFYMRRDRP